MHATADDVDERSCPGDDRVAADRSHDEPENKSKVAHLKPHGKSSVRLTPELSSEDGLALRSAEQLPEGPRLERADRKVIRHVEQIAIACDEDVGAAGDGSGHDPTIGDIANRAGCWLIGLRDEGKRSEHRLDDVDAIGWDLEFSRQHATEFSEDNLADHEIIGEDGAEDIAAEAARGEGGDQDVRIETDPHETASNTSSSVR